MLFYKMFAPFLTMHLRIRKYHKRTLFGLRALRLIGIGLKLSRFEHSSSSNCRWIRLRENLKTNSGSILIRYHPKLNLPVLLTLGFVLTTYLCSSFGRDRYNVTFKPINSKIHQILERLRSKVITLSSY